MFLKLSIGRLCKMHLFGFTDELTSIFSACCCQSAAWHCNWTAGSRGALAASWHMTATHLSTSSNEWAKIQMQRRLLQMQHQTWALLHLQISGSMKRGKIDWKQQNSNLNPGALQHLFLIKCKSDKDDVHVTTAICCSKCSPMLHASACVLCICSIHVKTRNFESSKLRLVSCWSLLGVVLLGASHHNKDRGCEILHWTSVQFLFFVGSGFMTVL